MPYKAPGRPLDGLTGYIRASLPLAAIKPLDGDIRA